MFVTSVLPPVNSLYHRKCLGQLQTVLRNGEHFAFSFWTLIFLIFSSGWFLAPNEKQMENREIAISTENI